jgi:cysteinyl-tRNA synthetase
MPLKIYNFLTHKKETFKPLHPKRVGLYTCGPTVYNYAHVGNLRTYIFEDILRRALEYAGYKVKHVMNITDIEDKIIRDAQKAGKPIYEFTEPYEKAFFGDLKKLDIKPAFKYPKATAHIPEMVKIISALLKNGLAYKAGGSVYFDISKFKKYGRLSGVKACELKAGARVDNDEYTKEEAEDFVLWKAKKVGEPYWQAPFGEGRPGWHIECSAMSMKYLGSTFDIHAGAVDLIFPHHENEIAQSEGATGKPFARYFIEGEHLLVNGEKMSKSLGNVYNLRDIEKKNFDPLAFRYLVLTAHYLSKLNFTWESLGAAQNALDKLREIAANLKTEKHSNILKNVGISEKHFSEKFKNYINNDLDMPRALALLWEIVKSEKLNAKTKYKLIIDFDKVLGLDIAKIKTEKIPAEILKLIKDREKYRKEKNFKKSDEIRKKIELLGWLVEDTPQGPKIRKQ